MAAIVSLGGVLLTAIASAGTAPLRLYTVAASEACLRGLPDAITGLPPATPPAKRVVFIYASPSSYLGPAMRGRLGAWSGTRRAGMYSGITMTFFKSLQSAKAYFKATSYGHDSLVRNAIVESDRPSVAGAAWRRSVRDCLRVTPSGAPPPIRPVPRACLATFVGYWGGHTRGLPITPGGQGTERVSGGCRTPEYKMTFQILSVIGTLTPATATYRTTYFKRCDKLIPNLHAGQVGKLLLRNGILTNTLSKVYFCSDPAWGATGACGA